MLAALILGYMLYYLVLQGAMTALGGESWPLWLLALNWLLIMLPLAVLRLNIGGSLRRLGHGLKRWDWTAWLIPAAVFGCCYWLRSSVMFGDYYLDCPLGAFWLPENETSRFVIRYVYALVDIGPLVLLGAALTLLLWDRIEQKRQAA